MPRPSILSLVFWSTTAAVWTPLRFSLLHDHDYLQASTTPAFFEATRATTANPGDGDNTTARSSFSTTATTRKFHRSKSKSTSTSVGVGVGANSGKKKDNNNRVVPDIDDQLGYFRPCPEA